MMSSAPDAPSPKGVRKTPSQARAQRTVHHILDAAAQILDGPGTARLTTNLVAERAGVSVGTLYQYFPNKAAVVEALLARRRATGEAELLARVASRPDASPDGAVRDVVASLIASARAHRDAGVRGLERPGDIDGRAARAEQALIQLWARRRVACPAAAADAFVLSRAVLGVVRAAALENSPLLDGTELEPALTRLVIAALRALETPARSPDSP